MSLSTRLMIAMVTLAFLTAAAAGFLAYRNIEAAILPLEFDRVKEHARQLAADLDVYVRGAKADVLSVRGSAAIDGIIQARLAGGRDPRDGTSEATWRERLSSLFTTELAAHPSYLQFRYIGAEDGGREIVRVERSAPKDAVRIVPDAELQHKGDRDYFTRALRFAKGEVYVSNIELNQEHGVIDKPYIPVLRIATPIFDPADRPFGILIINIDMRPIFSQLRAAANKGRQVYVVNEQGDYLVHPDSTREFGFDLGKSMSMQEDFPDLAAAFALDEESALETSDRAGQRIYAATAPVRPANGPRVVVIETVLYDEITSAAASVRRSSLLAGLVAVFLAFVLAIVLSRSLAKPLVRMTRAVESFTGSEAISVPTRERGEIGVLARAFERMSEEVREKTDALMQEITERKQAEDKFRMAVESSPSGMVMVDGSGTIILVNTETERLFGYRREELIGQSIDLLVPLRVRRNHPQYRHDFHTNPSSRLMGVGRDLYGLRKDGSEFPVEVGLNPIHTPDGLRILSAVVDITSRKAAEQAIAEQTLELQRSNAELEQFAYVASHDLQEPLRMVASYTELLGQRYGGKLDDRADKYIRYAVDGARRMQQLVNDLLAYSRVGTQGRPFQPTDSSVVLLYVLKGMRAVIKKSGADIQYGELPVVNADDVQLSQLFQNLIGNAIKFRADRPPRICISAKSNNGDWVFSVEDNGIGIDKQYSDRIFQMFQRLHERDKYEGSGIGLAIAKKIVERHGGRIWLDSEPGNGSTFYFTIPTVKGGDR